MHLHTRKHSLGGWTAGFGCLSSHIMKCRCPVVLQTSQCDSSPLCTESQASKYGATLRETTAPVKGVNIEASNEGNKTLISKMCGHCVLFKGNPVSFTGFFFPPPPSLSVTVQSVCMSHFV